MGREARGGAATGVHHPKIAAIGKHDAGIVYVRKAQQFRLRH
jgi:hypothetical protein